MAIAAGVVAALALFFTVASFWWMNWRPGHLKISPPRSYSASRTDSRLVFRFPFVFFNDGPTPIIVQNLRVKFADTEKRKPLSFQATVDRIDPGADQKRIMATQFPVRGQEAILSICEFQSNDGGPEFEVKAYPVKLQAKLNKDSDWRTVLEFPLNVGEKPIGGALLDHDNEAE